MTKDERILIRTCICNGFEFHSRSSEDNTVKIGETLFDFARLNDLADEIEAALDLLEQQRQEDRK